MIKNQTNHKRVVYSLSFVALLLLSGVTVASEPLEDTPALIIVENADIDEVITSITALDGSVLHILPPHALIGLLSPEAEEHIQQNADVTVHRGPVDLDKDWEEQITYAVTAWNYNYMGLSVDAGLNEPPVSPEPPPTDIEILPDISPYLVHNGYTVAMPYGAGFTDTSAYLVGSVAVGVLFLESNGTIDEDMESWTEEEKANVTAEIQNGLNWLLSEGKDAALTFVYEWHYNVPVGYEPITRPHTDDDLWEQQAMHHLGYTNPHYLVNEYTYANDLRQKYGTDWAFIIFVVDDAEDEDNAFQDGMYAYSFLGGPRMVVTYSNSIWGIANLDSIVAHETCHIFWALDQHCNSEVEQTEISGYLAGENTNSEWNGESCTETVPCIMKGETMLNTQIDVTARTQLGWKDTDSDGIFDVVDTLPDITVNHDGGGFCTGTAVVSPLPNENPFCENDISLQVITQVQYRVDQGAWIDAEAVDGTFDGPEEPFEFAVALETGEHVIEVRAQNSVGNWSSVESVDLVIEEENPLLQCEIAVSPAQANCGDDITVLMTVHNTGDAPALSVEPQLTAPDSVECVSGPQPASQGIAPGESETFAWVYTVTEVEEDAVFSFTGSATGLTEAGGTICSKDVESNTVDVYVEPLINCDVTALLYGVIEGSTITLTMEVHNTGEVLIENVVPSEVTVSFTGTAAVSCLSGPTPQPPITLEPGEMKTFEWTYASAPGIQGGEAVFTASVSGEAEGQRITSDTAKATVGIRSPAIVTTFIIATPENVSTGDTITVAMTVQNIGQAAAVDVVPSELTVSGTGTVALKSGPSRESVRVEGRTFEILVWTYTAEKEGTVTFSGTVQGVDESTGDALSVPEEKSNVVTITIAEDTDGNESTDTDGNESTDESTDTDGNESTDTDGNESTDTDGNESTDESTDTDGNTDEQDTPPEPSPTPPATDAERKKAENAIQKVKDLLKEARTTFEERQRQNRDIRLCQKLLKEVELHVQQAELYFERGNYDEAYGRALRALIKVFELLNCLNNL
jgi:hypothetical protein